MPSSCGVVARKRGRQHTNAVWCQELLLVWAHWLLRPPTQPASDGRRQLTWQVASSVTKSSRLRSCLALMACRGAKRQRFSQGCRHLLGVWTGWHQQAQLHTQDARLGSPQTPLWPSQQAGCAVHRPCALWRPAARPQSPPLAAPLRTARCALVVRAVCRLARHVALRLLQSAGAAPAMCLAWQRLEQERRDSPLGLARWAFCNRVAGVWARPLRA